MPAAFAYLAAAFVLVVVGLLLLASALLIALVPRWRPLAKRIALGVPGSAVGLLAFQLAAFPVVLAILWTFLVPVGYFHGSGGVTTNPLIVVLSIGSILVATAFFGTASLGGLVFGWRAANALGQGIALRTYLASEEIWQVVATAFRRPYRLPLLLWLLCVWSVFGIWASRCWLNSGVTVAEVSEAYRATAPLPERNVLDIKADGSWEYRRESHLEGERAAGRWEFEPAQSDSTTVVLSFEVKSGSNQDQSSSLRERDPLAQAGFVYGSVSRDCAGKLIVCFGADDQVCFEQQRETGERRAATGGTPDRLRTLAARAPLRLTLLATCRL